MAELRVRVITDTPSGDALRDVFKAYWPAYRRWMRRAPTTSADAGRQALGRHMPELLPPFERLCARFGGGDDVGRFLALWRPPRVVRACTQLVLDASDGPRLLRSYDHDPRLFDGLVLRSRWTGGTTLAVTDCLWGALDGMNEHGLAIALAFGGRSAVGDGFAAPLICRYVLETCRTVAEARVALHRLPVAMPYTFVVVDAAGAFVTAFTGPDVEATFVARRSSANHQGRVEWPAYARSVQSLERQACAEGLLSGGVPIDEARGAFLAPPVWRTDYARASGTLYVAEYAVVPQTLTLSWPGRVEDIELSGGADRSIQVELPAARPGHAPEGTTRRSADAGAAGARSSEDAG